MFFFGIFGVDQKQKEIKDITNRTCKNCESLTAYRIIKTYMFFHIFFIPIAKWNEEYYIISRCCNSVFSIPKEKGKLIESGQNIEIYDSDMHIVRKGDIHDSEYCNDISQQQKVCSKCGKEVFLDYKFCPYCGQKLNNDNKI